MSSFSFSGASRSGLGVVVLLACGGGLFAQTVSHKPSASATDPVVISAGGEHLRASQFEALLKGAPAANQAAMESHKRAVADQLGKMMALVDEAHRQGLDQNPEFKAQMMLARDNALAKALVDKLQQQATPSDAQAKAYYDAHQSEFAQMKVRHILIGDSETKGGPSPRTAAQALAKAQSIEAQLQKGANFATLAKADSDDPGSKAKGGELGEIVPGQTVPEFDAALKNLPVGKISPPIHTRFGYHIVEVEARTTMPFEKAKPEIVQQLTSESVSKAIDQIAANEHVSINSSYFGPDTAPAAVPAQK